MRYRGRFASLIFLIVLISACNDKETTKIIEQLPVENVENNVMPLSNNIPITYALVNYSETVVAGDADNNLVITASKNSANISASVNSEVITLNDAGIYEITANFYSEYFLNSTTSIAKAPSQLDPPIETQISIRDTAIIGFNILSEPAFAENVVFNNGANPPATNQSGFIFKNSITGIFEIKEIGTIRLNFKNFVSFDTPVTAKVSLKRIF